MCILVENNHDITLKKILEDFFNQIDLRVSISTHNSPKISCKNLCNSVATTSRINKIIDLVYNA